MSEENFIPARLWRNYMAVQVFVPFTVILVACAGAPTPTPVSSLAITRAPTATVTQARALTPVPTTTALSPTPIAKPAPEAIEIGAVVPLTGPYGAGGENVKIGYEIAAEDINRGGGVFVKEFNKKIPLRVTVLDSESDPTKTVARLESHLADRRVVAYLGACGNDLQSAATAIAEKNKVPYLSVVFTLWKIHQRGYKYVFSPYWKSPDVATSVYEMLNAYISEGQRPTQVAIFQEKTDWGVELGGLWKTNAPKYGYTIVSYEEYTPGSEDFSDIITKAKAAGAETVLALPTIPDGINLIKQMAELDFNAKFYLAIRAADSPFWDRDLGKIGDYVTLVPGWHHAMNFPGVKELNEKHQAKFGRPPDFMVGPAYASVQILAAAIEKAGTLDREKVRDVIAGIELNTVMGNLTFRADGTGVVQTPIVQRQKGKFELVWPKEFATATFVYPAPKWKER